MQLYHHVFLSYSPPDYHAMLQVHNFLTSQRLLVCSNQRDVELDDASWRAEIENRIDFSGCIIVLLSPDAKESKWVQGELKYAREQEKKIFPFLVRGEEADAIPTDLLKTPRIDISSDLSQVPAIVKEIRKLLGIPEPPPPKPEPEPEKKPNLANIFIVFGIFIISIVLFIFSSELQSGVIKLPDTRIASAMSNEKSVTYEQGTLRVLSQRSNISRDDLLRLEHVRIQTYPSGTDYYAIEFEFECKLVYCNVPPEAGILLTSEKGGQPAYPLNYLALRNETIMQPVGLGGKTRGWIIFSINDFPSHIIVNPGVDTENQQRIALN